MSMIRERNFLEALQHADTGVVDPHVDAAECGERRLRERSTSLSLLTSVVTAMAPLPDSRANVSISVVRLAAARRVRPVRLISAAPLCRTHWTRHDDDFIFDFRCGARSR
jgi:hypothetical protein